MPNTQGELYVRVEALATGGTPRQIVDIGQPVSGVIINAPLPAGVRFKVCRRGASDGIELFDFDAITDLWCPALMDGLFCYIIGNSPGTFIELVALSGQGGTVTR